LNRKGLIITGDDFGLAIPVNEAIEHAYRHGVLTTTSLLVGAASAADAIERARANPGLRVGLHLAVCEGMPICRPHEIPDLVAGHGELHAPFRAAVGLVVWSKRQLEREMRAQFEAFRATGLTLDHVNGHNNMQLHPVVLPILISLAREYGARAIRVSSEPLRASLRAARYGRTCPAEPAAVQRRRRAATWLRVTQWLAIRPWGAYVKWRYRRAGFTVNDQLFGMYDCGGMDLDMFLGIIRHLPDGVSEIHCHPATRRCPEIDGPMPEYQHESELSALTSPVLREAIRVSGARALRGYSELEMESTTTLRETSR
jgi:hopanoid biosynthesis associated protein HpnK